ncbi:DUF3667 domain-containing protein [Arenibacter sp. GZD96]|uniref:DUF3667 domain-containing protein n=1 Tax=Aurantibrevibacter litoralis TaxID=3106030 RepID=UPI002AFF04CF|nr:DUF3667 domain-containing protein [Arenibacter sp. GZD-96]MEA1784746.1 DUF3667 domain-containing protein [Arenibacter sp. GZD-96]
MSTTKECLNCELNYEATFAYCPHCGQKGNDTLTMKVLFSQTISNYFSLDARFFKSYIPLMFKPGVVARRYVDGKRLQYLHPAQFYLFVSVVFFFLFSLVTRQQQYEFDEVLKKGFETDLATSPIETEDKDLLKKDLPAEKRMVLDSIHLDTVNVALFGYMAKKSTLDSLIIISASKEDKLALFGITEHSGGFVRLVGGQSLKIYEQRGGGILKSFYDTIPVVMFFVLPIFALILKVLYRKSGTFAHHMVFSFYYFTFLFMVFSFMTFLNLIIDVPRWIDILVFMSTFVYLILALRKFYQQRIMRTIIKTGVLTFIYATIVAPISFVLMLFISLLLY